MKLQKEAALMILAYYQVIDSDHEAEDYLQRVDSITNVCLNTFRNRNDNEDNPVISLFTVLTSLERNALVLDRIGAEEMANALDEIHSRADANLRAVVSKLTGQDISTNENQTDQEFISQFDVGVNNLYWFEFYRNNKKDKS